MKQMPASTNRSSYKVKLSKPKSFGASLQRLGEDGPRTAEILAMMSLPLQDGISHPVNLPFPLHKLWHLLRPESHMQ